jgi:ABC-type nitrate/sulfonate/bicarbonate transport systems, periplasmic components
MTLFPSRRDFLRRSFATSLAVGLGGGLIAACGDDESDPSAGTAGTGSTTTAALKATQLSVMMPFPLSVNFIADAVAKSGGFMEDVGIDLDLQFARSAPQALQQLVAGNVSVVRNGPVEMVQAVTGEGAPFVSIGMPNQRTNYTLTSSPDEPFAMADLAGHTVGLPTLGGNAEFVFDLLLKAAGVDPTAVKRQAVGLEASAYGLMQEGVVEALFVTTSTNAGIKALGENPHVDTLDDANPLLGTNLVTTRKLMDERHDDIVAYLKGLHAAMLAIHDEARLTELIPVTRADWDLPQLDDVDKAKGIIASVATRWFDDGEENLLRNIPDRWEAGITQLVELGYLPEGTEATDFYTNDLLDEALS